LLADFTKIAGTPAKSCWWLKPDDVSVTVPPGAQPPPVDPDTVRLPPAGTEAGETLMEAAAPAASAATSSASTATAAASAPSERALALTGIASRSSTLARTVKVRRVGMRAR
jgi:hypothetical protein